MRIARLLLRFVALGAGLVACPSCDSQFGDTPVPTFEPNPEGNDKRIRQIADPSSVDYVKSGGSVAVSGAVVVLHAPGGASTRRAITDDDGECVYVLTGVPTLDGDGNVSLEAEVSGAAASVDAVRVAPTTTFTAGDALAVRPSTTSRVVLRVT